MKRLLGGERMKWAHALAKHKFVGILSVVVIATGALFILPHIAKAEPHPTPASARWVNRQYLEDNEKHVFKDSNTFDTTYEYVQETSEACPNKLLFKVKSGAQGSEPLDNIYFYYNANAYNNRYDKKILTGNPGVDPVRGFATCTYTEKDIPVSEGDNRRITWIHDETSKKIYYIFNSQTSFVQKSDFKNIGRFYRESEVADSSNSCPDIILLHAANPGSTAENVFGRSDTAGSSILYSVEKNNDLARVSESYNIISEPNDIGPGTCHIRGSALDKKLTGEYAQYSSGKVEEDNWIISAGLNSDGVTAPNDGDFKDDAFITFLGKPGSNLPSGASGAPIVPPAGGDNPDGQSDEVDKQTCKGGAMGWVICPIVSAIQSIADLLKKLMESLLTVNPLPLDTNKEVYVIWNNIRNFANIAFVIVFFVIIFSQATSIGISNYGIKKLLPNLIAVAIATNLSYYICAFLIDTFNIFGVGIYNLVAIVNGGQQGTIDVSNGAGALLVGLGAAGAGAAFYTASVVQFFPLLVAAIIGMAITFVVLVIRQAAIIVLVIIAPLAFIAGILPGTQNWLSKWFNVFAALLLMYPLVMLLFAGARLAGAILTATAPSGILGTAMEVVGLIVQVVMGFAAIFLFKWAIVAKGALGRIAGNLNDKTKGLTKKAQDYGENTGFFQRRQMARDARAQERRRRNVTGYSEAMTPGADAGRIRRARAALLRRRAAGGLTGQLFNTNQAGQARAQYTAEDTLRRQSQEEAQRAGLRMSRIGIEGDGDLQAIARALYNPADPNNSDIDANGIFHQRRNGVLTGVQIAVGDAERQAAINSLVQQGRVNPLRRLEALQARGDGGRPVTEMHNMLDDAYTSVPNKLGDKAPDLMPNRRATEGVAAFTDLQPSDVAAWHYSTVEAATNFYNTQRRDNNGNVITDPNGRPINEVERDQMLRAFSQATQSPVTRANLSLDQVTRVRNMMNAARTAGQTIDPTVAQNIDNTYTQMGGV